MGLLGRRRPRGGDVQIHVSEKAGIRSLHMGSDAIQSSMSLRDPFELVLGYSRCMFAFLLFRDLPRHLLIIGLGGGSLPKFAHRHLSTTRTEVVELHPEVVAVARSMFHLPPDDDRLSIVEGDGAAHIQNLLNPVDVIMLDAYGAEGIAPALSTAAFFVQCRDRLTAQGVLVVNLWGSDPKFRVYTERLGEAFAGRVLCLPARQRGNVTAMCFKRGCDQPYWNELLERAKVLEAHFPLEFTEFVTDLARMNLHDDRGLLI